MLDPKDINLDPEEENLDDDYDETKARKFLHEGGEPEMSFSPQQK